MRKKKEKKTIETDLRDFRGERVLIVNIGHERATLDAGGSGGEEAEVGFSCEDDRIGAEVSSSESGYLVTKP